MIFKNAKDVPLNANSGTMPNVTAALLNWFQPMIFGVVTKTTVAFQVVETVVETSFLGVWQPFGPRQLLMKPEGQRKWPWFMLHAQPQLDLDVDDIIRYLGIQYRVMANNDYRLDGYIEYHLVEDYNGSGPTP